MDRFLSSRDYVRELVLTGVNQLFDNERVISLNGTNGEISSMVASNSITNVRLKLGDGSIVSPTFPFAFTDETELTVYFDLVDFTNNNGFIKIIGRYE